MVSAVKHLSLFSSLVNLGMSFARNVAPKVGFVRGKACEPFTSGMVSEVKHLSLFPSLVNLGMSLAWSRAQRKKRHGKEEEYEDYRRRK